MYPNIEIDGWALSPRGAGYLFGGDVVKRFNFMNNLGLIARAHQLVMEGYKYMFSDSIVTVWSAPNYCYRCGNEAAILELGENGEQGFQKFEAAQQDAKGMPTKKVMMLMPLTLAGCRIFPLECKSEFIITVNTLSVRTTLQLNKNK